uniref:YhhN-like protein n=1 Tax=Parastrongyloides trichosuri TaxID=131310 RepID=A0A0N4Z536_PARTI
MPRLNNSSIIYIYFGASFLAYFGTDGFKVDSPIVSSMPVVILAILTLFTFMEWKAKFLTALSFLISAWGLYSWYENPNFMEKNASYLLLSKVLYLSSFVSCLIRFWSPAFFIMLTYAILFIYFCFLDLFLTLPLLIIILSASMTVLAFEVSIGASIWKYDSYQMDTKYSAFLRLFGLLLLTTYESCLYVDKFGASYFSPVAIYLNIFYYISHLLLFVANERSF